jgi:hypothetical protein
MLLYVLLAVQRIVSGPRLGAVQQGLATLEGDGAGGRSGLHVSAADTVCVGRAVHLYQRCLALACVAITVRHRERRYDPEVSCCVKLHTNQDLQSFPHTPETTWPST